MTSEVKLKTGGDPRSLPDYAALRDEISKLTHPARPDVDWCYVETLCLRLYEQWRGITDGILVHHRPDAYNRVKWPE